ESGRLDEATVHFRASTETGRELADVPAAISFAYFAMGKTEEAARLLARAKTLDIQGRSDIAGSDLITVVDSVALLSDRPAEAVELLASALSPYQFDPSQLLERRVVLAHAHLAAGDHTATAQAAYDGLADSKAIGAVRAELRFALIAA